jgi:hypothetical protein
MAGTLEDFHGDRHAVLPVITIDCTGERVLLHM